MMSFVSLNMVFLENVGCILFLYFIKNDKKACFVAFSKRQVRNFAKRHKGGLTINDYCKIQAAMDGIEGVEGIPKTSTLLPKLIKGDVAGIIQLLVQNLHYVSSVTEVEGVEVFEIDMEIEEEPIDITLNLTELDLPREAEQILMGAPTTVAHKV